MKKLFLLMIVGFIVMTMSVFAADSNTTDQVNVNNIAPEYINDSWFSSPDPADPGQTVTFYINLTDDNGCLDIVTFYLTVDAGTNTTTADDVNITLSSTDTVGNCQYNGSYTLPIGATPGNWYLTNGTTVTDLNGLNATPPDNLYNSSILTVNTDVALALLNYPIDFGNVNPNTQNNSAQVGNGFPLTINHTGNVDENFSVAGTDMVNGSYSIGVGNVTIDDDNTLSEGVETGQITEFDLSGTSTQVQGDVTKLTLTDVYWWIDAPLGMFPLTYVGNVTITAIAS